MQSLPFRFAVFSEPRHLTPRARPGTPKDIRRTIRRVTFPFLLYQTRYGVNCFAQPIAALGASVSPQNGAGPLTIAKTLLPSTTFPAKWRVSGCILRASTRNRQ